MPKVPIDHQKTIIYKIICNDPNVKDLYIGHTTNFVRRRAIHRSNSLNDTNKDCNMQLYQVIRYNGGWTNWNMEEVEKYQCNNVIDANRREMYWFELLNANLEPNFIERKRY